MLVIHVADHESARESKKYRIYAGGLRFFRRRKLGSGSWVGELIKGRMGSTGLMDKRMSGKFCGRWKRNVARQAVIVGLCEM
jgi:hypothetical protein